MKFEATKITKVIEQNYSHLMPDFFEMQTEYLASLNIIYHDLDASLVAMVITSKLYKNTIKNISSTEKISLKKFYETESFKISASEIKIKDISNLINLPRETVRRKKAKLIKDNLIVLNKKTKMYSLNTEMIGKNIIDLQIANLSKFLSKFSYYFSKNRFFVKEVSREEIRKDVEEKFLLYFTKFLDFQISYLSKCKTLLDIESTFIVMLCSLNETSKFKNNEKPTNFPDTFIKISQMKLNSGLNATSISDITKVPRTTVLRKISQLVKSGMLKKDKFKRYSIVDFTKLGNSKKIESIVNYNVSLLGFFFTDCLKTYVIKN